MPDPFDPAAMERAAAFIVDETHGNVMPNVKEVEGPRDEELPAWLKEELAERDKQARQAVEESLPESAIVQGRAAAVKETIQNEPTYREYMALNAKISSGKATPDDAARRMELYEKLRVSGVIRGPKLTR